MLGVAFVACEVLMSIWSLCLPHFWRRQEAVSQRFKMLFRDVLRWGDMRVITESIREAKCAISWGSMDLVAALCGLTLLSA